MDTLNSEFEEKIKEISNLSSKINKGDNRKLFQLIDEHIREVKERYNNSDEHWTIETADLIILCYELLVLENKDIDTVFNKCLPRYDIKLKRLAENAELHQ